MFEHYVDFQKPRRPLWVRIAIAASVLAHIGVAAVLIITAAWRINKLSIDDGGIAIASLGMPSSAPPPLASSEKLERKPLIKTEDLAQQEDATENRVASSSASDVGNPDGHPDGIVGSDGDTPGAFPGTGALGSCSGVECLRDINPPAPRPVVVNPPRVVEQKAMEALLLSGETQIRPSNTVKMKIQRDGKSSVHAIVRACISASGQVTSAKILKTTGHPSYDQKLVAGVRRWSYRPYRVNGKAIPVCTTISFLYRML